MSTLSTEMDKWLERQLARHVPAPPKPRPEPPPCPLTPAEMDWLWPRYQACSFPPASNWKNFARTPRASLTLRGMNFAVRAAYRFRRQIAGTSAGKWGMDEFISAVRTAASAKPKGDTST